MAVVRKKQDDKNLKLLRELVTTGAGNRQCFDCGQKGPTYVNMTIGTFVCTRCSGVLRGLTPPHRVKSISMATFTPEEIEFLKSHGNEECAKTWLGLWDPKRNVHQDQRELIIDKYERKRYYLEPGSPLKSITNLNNNSNNSNNSIINTNPTTNILTKTNSSSNNSSYNHLTNGLKSITLTPPSSRGSHSSLNGSLNGSTGGGSISTKQSDGFNINTSAVNGFNNFLNRKTSNSSVDCGSSINGNCNGSSGFSSDSDFADFGSANIFDATLTGGNNSVSSNNSSFNNSFKQQNGFDNIALQNGRSPASAVNNENFADFDHAPIYNAAGLPATNPHINGNTNNTSMKTSSVAPSVDRYAALKDLDEEFRETKAQAAAQVAASTIATNGNNVMGSPNPFKAQQPVANPFQATGNVQIFQNSAPVAPQPMFGSGFNTNGFTNGTNFGGSPYVPNGSCGFGIGAMQPQQPIAATGFSNPFAATVNSGNSNNPFL